MSKLIEFILPRRRLVIVCIHAVLVALAYTLAFLVRFEFQLRPASGKSVS